MADSFLAPGAGTVGTARPRMTVHLPAGTSNVSGIAPTYLDQLFPARLKKNRPPQGGRFFSQASLRTEPS
jgi:hypothetical protein